MHKPKFYKYTEDQLREAVATSLSIRSALRKLGVAPYGGNYQVIKNAITYFNLSTTHFTGQAWNKGRKHAPKRELSCYLVKGGPGIGTHKLRLRLIKEGIFEKECIICGIDEWRGSSLSLELDHINGISGDNRIENLRILCPNCHSQTHTFRGRNKANLARR